MPTAGRTVSCAGVALWAGLTGVGCGSVGPTGPSGFDVLSVATISAGRYTLSIIAGDFVNSRVACPGIGRVGSMVGADVTVERSGNEWRGRPTRAEDGAFEMRFRDGGPGTLGTEVRLTGTLRGVVHNPHHQQVPALGTAGLRVLVGDAGTPLVALEGTTLPGLGSLNGTISGPVTFVAANGESVSCVPGTVGWFLNRAFVLGVVP